MMESKLFQPCDYKNILIDRNILDSIDKAVTGDRLIFNNPLTATSIKNIRLGKLNIYQIKRLLKYAVYNKNSREFQNALAFKIKNFTKDDIKRVLVALDFYEQQIVRLMSENIVDKNLFFSNQSKREMLVQEQLREIVEYILDNANETVWGNISNSQRKLLLSFFSSRGGRISENTKNNFIQEIVDYTTLSELESGIVKTKTIDRFIVKRG